MKCISLTRPIYAVLWVHYFCIKPSGQVLFGKRRFIGVDGFLAICLSTPKERCQHDPDTGVQELMDYTR